MLAEIEAARAAAGLQGRTDLRALALLTIDPADARDHDDAVYAEPDADPANPGGFIVHVAIADVAHYVRPGTRLDREAQMRGNSVYFPDRVVPMLPERISNDLCSLREGEDRRLPRRAACVFDRHGNKKSHTFLRAMMRSAAKLSYQEAQAAIDGKPSAQCRAALMERAGAAVGGLSGAGRMRATAASRSTSTCPSARSCSTRRAASRAWWRRSASRRTA